MHRKLLAFLIPIIAIAGPAASGATPVESAHELAELRLESPPLVEAVGMAKAEFEAVQQVLNGRRNELTNALVDRVVALEDLERVEDELRAARASFDEGVEQMYMRGGTAALTTVVFFDDPTEAGIATHYLQAVGESEIESLDDIERLLIEMSDLKYTAFDAVDLAEVGFAEQERAFIAAAGRLAELEYDLGRLDRQISRLTAEWSDYRLSLAEDILESTGATGILESATITQAELRASLPLGPTIGIPPGLAPTGRSLSGIASWYGPGFHGRRSSSGAIYDERDFTIAHKTLPHETLLLVTYGDRQAVVMVNDRGPFIEGREFDLSRATAEYLGVGLNNVKVEVLTLLP